MSTKCVLMRLCGFNNSSPKDIANLKNEIVKQQTNGADEAGINVTPTATTAAITSTTTTTASSAAPTKTTEKLIGSSTASLVAEQIPEITAS